VDVDDAVEAVVEFENGAVGTIEATRFAVGRKNGLAFEINGSEGSIAFDLERLNELSVHLERTRPGASAQGFRRVLVTEPDHPYIDMWWPPGHTIGWEHTFSHELLHLLTAIATDGPIGPDGATFEDGYRAAEVCDALLRASETGQRQTLAYRTADG
jgi:predicted dehydrogenase